MIRIQDYIHVKMDQKLKTGEIVIGTFDDRDVLVDERDWLD
jgi:hypothetical protein